MCFYVNKNGYLQPLSKSVKICNSPPAEPFSAGVLWGLAVDKPVDNVDNWL